MNEQSVTLLNSTTVTPQVPTHRQLLYLSSLDLFWREVHYNRRIVFYAVQTCDFREIVRRLQESLAAVLVHFFPLAGRLAHGEDGRFVIDCNDAGVEFVQASIEASLSELGENFEFQPYFTELAPLGHLKRSDLCDVPLLSVQVTQFLGGGFSIGVSHSHVAADGHSLWHFMTSWGECARGLVISKPPVHDRTAFRPEMVSEEVAKGIPFELEEVEQPAAGGEDLEERVFHFTGEAIRRLKGKAQGGERAASSFEALCAHCWRQLTRARAVAENSRVNCIVLANWRMQRRGRAAPPVTEAYFGNAIIYTAAIATAGEILKEDFQATVARIICAVDICTNLDSLLGTIHWLELHDTKFDILPPQSRWFRGTHVNIAGSPRFQVYNIDFGWGPPPCIRPACVGGAGELCLFPSCPSIGDDGIDVCTKLDPSSMERLHSDPLFLCPD